MKQVLLLVLVSTTFGFTRAQSKVYSIDKYGYNKTAFMLIDGGKIYDVDKYGYNVSIRATTPYFPKILCDFLFF